MSYFGSLWYGIWRHELFFCVWAGVLLACIVWPLLAMKMARLSPRTCFAAQVHVTIAVFICSYLAGLDRLFEFSVLMFSFSGWPGYDMVLSELFPYLRNLVYGGWATAISCAWLAILWQLRRRAVNEGQHHETGVAEIVGDAN